jgi:hypothetical protein
MSFLRMLRWLTWSQLRCRLRSINAAGVEAVRMAARSRALVRLAEPREAACPAVDRRIRERWKIEEEGRWRNRRRRVA